MARSAAVQIEVDGPDGPRSMRVSSPDRVLWPEVGITKLDLANYVVAVGPALLRAFGDRPVTLERYPEGVGGEAFYSKNRRAGCRTSPGRCRWSTRAGAAIRSW